MKPSRSSIRIRVLLSAFATCALLLGSGASGADVNEEGLRRAEQFLDGLTGLKAQFKQKLTDRSGQVTDESSGTLAIKRPNRFRWDYLEPYEQVIVADGVRVWVYDSDLDQVTVRKLDAALSSTPAMLLSGGGALTDNFTVTDSTQQGAVLWVRMEPKRNDTDFKAVRLGFSGSTSQELRFMELADKLGQTTLLEFAQFERNPQLDDARFAFEVPPGADVIGDAGAPASQR